MSNLRTVEDYGAVGDGKTDDTAAIQRAFDAGVYIFIEGKTYKVRTIKVRRRSASISGARLKR